jgi:hypothetical protein
LVVFWVSEGACRVRSWGLGFAGWRLRLEAGGCRLRLETGSLKGGRLLLDGRVLDASGLVWLFFPAILEG